MDDEKEMSGQDINLRIMREISGVREDIRELMTTMKHTNEDVKEIKVMATEAASEAESAHNKAKQALHEAGERKKEMEDLEKRQAAQQKEQRTIRRWAIGVSVSFGMPLLAIVVTVVIFILGG